MTSESRQDDQDDLREKLLTRVKETLKTLPKEDYPFPLYLIIEPTNICNLACVMCPSKIQTRDRGVMDLGLWKKLMDEVAEKGQGKTIVWPAIMGEGLTAGEKFMEMLRYAAQKKVPVKLNTNAGLLTEDRAREMVEMGNIHEFIIGLDAVESKAYEQIRVKGNFERTVQNVRKLVELARGKSKVTVQLIEQEANAGQAEAFREEWLRLGASVKIRPKLGWGEGVAADNLLLKQEDRLGPCPWLIRTMNIHWNGTVVQCDADWDQKHPVADLNEMTIEQAWQGPLKEIRSRHRGMNFNFDPCRTCGDWQAGLSGYYEAEQSRS